MLVGPMPQGQSGGDPTSPFCLPTIMNRQPPQERLSNTARKRAAGSLASGSLAVVILLAIYAVAQPALNQRFGWNLPALGEPQPANNAAENVEQDGANAPPLQPGAVDADGLTRGPAADSDETLRFGLLREVQPDRYVSPQGLMYVPGSAEGHRLEHLRRHTRDQPSRPGKHGVFEGGMEGALTTVDSAYQFAKNGERSTKQIDRGRAIYTIDMGRRVGYVGGAEGRRLNHPAAHRVKLVLEGVRVITAFPL